MVSTNMRNFYTVANMLAKTVANIQTKKVAYADIIRIYVHKNGAYASASAAYAYHPVQIYTFSYKHADGRVVYPFVFIFYSPIGPRKTAVLLFQM